jgi:hypothetical protein
MGVWQGVAIDSLKFRPGLPCPTLLRPLDGPPLKRPYCFRDGPPARRVACLWPSLTPLDTSRRTPMTLTSIHFAGVVGRGADVAFAE